MRVIQACWLALGIMHSLQFSGVYKLDHVISPREERRRLTMRARVTAKKHDLRLSILDATVVDSGSGQDFDGGFNATATTSCLGFSNVDVKWIFGAFFEFDSLSCVPAAG